jgi:hypothetical protein
LHLGFHYPRSYKTRIQVLTGFAEFNKRYKSLTFEIPTNIYAVSEKSNLDFGTFAQVMRASKVPFQVVDHHRHGLSHIEGALLTHERGLYADEPRSFFRNLLGDSLHLNSEVVDVQELRGAKTDTTAVSVNGKVFDWCINCTYNRFAALRSPENVFYETCLTLIYEDTQPDEQLFAITVMDGPFSSLYPYVPHPSPAASAANAAAAADGSPSLASSASNTSKRATLSTSSSAISAAQTPRLYTLTNVQHTPLAKFDNIFEANAAMKAAQLNSDSFLAQKKLLFEQGIMTYFPQFGERFKYRSYFISMKTKLRDESADRECIIRVAGKVINVMSGKVNTLYFAEREVLQHLNLAPLPPKLTVQDHDVEIHDPSDVLDEIVLPDRFPVGFHASHEQRFLPPLEYSLQ